MYRSNGKILLTSEYLVMLGAKALAFPVKYGQSMQVTNTDRQEATINWSAKEINKKWFSAQIDYANLKVLSSGNNDTADYLLTILSTLKELNPDFLSGSSELSIDTNTDFPREWGLGTSSTLIANLAKWAKVDPFELHSKVSSGSGYDIACANSNSPLVFQRDKSPKVEEIDFNKNFLDNLYFVYSGRKQKTESHIGQFLKDANNCSREIEMVSRITDEVLQCNNLTDFIRLMHEHERLISRVTGSNPVGKCYFGGFNGIVKSLGAWGGDFLLAVSPMPQNYVVEYFEQFKLSVLIPFKEMVLSPTSDIKK